MGTWVKKALTAIGVTVLLIQPLSVFSVSIDYNIDAEGYITISGTSDIEDYVSIQVVKPGKTPTNETANLKSELDNFFVVLSDDTGHYSWKYKLSGDTGWYNIRVNTLKNTGEISEKKFYFVTAEELQKIADFLKSDPSISDADTLKTAMLVTYKDELGLDLAAYSDIQNMAGQMVFQNVFQNLNQCKDIYQIKDAFYSAVLAQSINYAKNGEEVKRLLNDAKNKKILGVDITQNETFLLMNTQGQEAFYEDIRKHAFGNCEEIQNALPEILVREALLYVGSWGEVLPIVRLNREAIKNAYPAFDFNQYEGYSDRGAIDRSLAGREYSLKELGAKINELSGRSITAGGNISFGSGGGNLGGGRVAGATGQLPVPEIPNEQKEEQSSQEEFFVFMDVPKNHWAYTAIQTLSEKKIVAGVGSDLFEPEGNVTREEFVKMLIGAFHLKLKEETSSFVDVPENHWCSPYVCTAKNLGIVNGSDGVFGLGENITREDAATMIDRVCDKLGIQIKDNAVEISFYDIQDVSDYALEAVISLTQAGVLNGYGNGCFEPKNTMTRAEAAKILAFFVDYLG